MSFLTGAIAFISLLVLVVLHELGHFFVAKKFNVKVEEFGIGLPPRIFGKRFGETLYSLNLLPVGAFVRLLGEEEAVAGPRSFSQKSILQRALIVAGGVISFWIIAVVLLSVVMAIGVPTAIEDDAEGFKNPQVQITGIAPDSPAKEAGLKLGDVITDLRVRESSIEINKVGQVQELTVLNKGEEIVLTVKRGKESLSIPMMPRLNPPEGQGPLGIALVRVALNSYPWWQAPLKGVEETVVLTGAVINGLISVAANVFRGQGLPQGAELMGPIGIGSWLVQAVQLGVSYYLRFIAMLAIYLALFNALPIPAVDGGKLFFLGLELVRKKPLPQKFEQNITAVFFLLLVTALVLVTVNDIVRIVN